MNFERVKREEADTVLKLYRSLLGTPYCVWTEEYPSEKEVEFDLSRDALFCMRDDAGNIAGVISIDDDPNVECLTCWSETMVPVSYTHLDVKENSGIYEKLPFTSQKRPEADFQILKKVRFARIQIRENRWLNRPWTMDFWKYGYQGKKFIVVATKKEK